MNIEEQAKSYASDLPTERDRKVAQAAFEDGSATMAITLSGHLVDFFQHLIDTHLIDCSSLEDIMSKWEDFTAK